MNGYIYYSGYSYALVACCPGTRCQPTPTRQSLSSPRRTAPRSLQSVVLLRNTLTAYFRRSSYSVRRSFMIVLSVVL